MAGGSAGTRGLGPSSPTSEPPNAVQQMANPRGCQTTSASVMTKTPITRPITNASSGGWRRANPIGALDVLQPDLSACDQALGIVPDLDQPKLLQPAPVDGCRGRS
jgi:hypothetical protein